MRAATLSAFAFLAMGSAAAGTLDIQGKVPLPGCKGRIDHLAFDPERRRLFVAELGNNTVAVIDVDKRQLDRRLDGHDEPQGIAYFAPLNRIYVADGGDGTVRSYDATTFKLATSVKLSGDSDNVRIDPVAKRVYVGYGDGALAVLDPDTLQHIGDIPLKAHPESFQLSSADDHIYVNVPDARQIAVVDRKSGRQVASWPARIWLSNYPMAIDEESQSVLSVFRVPARIARYSTKDGTVLAEVEACGDADDVFVDARRNLAYVVCGQGVVDVLDRKTLKRIDRIPTAPGARTGLYSAAADVLFVAARAEGGHEAAVWILKPGD